MRREKHVQLRNSERTVKSRGRTKVVVLVSSRVTRHNRGIQGKEVAMG